jgi:uncharacterized protein YodC (DUF2158 family)
VERRAARLFCHWFDGHAAGVEHSAFGVAATSPPRETERAAEGYAEARVTLDH